MALAIRTDNFTTPLITSMKRGMIIKTVAGNNHNTTTHDVPFIVLPPPKWVKFLSQGEKHR
jgi:hypothetical protein